MTGRALQAFDDESEALDWLAAQAVPKQATESPADAVAVRFVSYLDVEILEIDFRGCGGAELLRRVEIAARTIRSRPERSVLTLTFVHGIRYEKATTVAIREYVRLNKPFVRASAVVGLDWLKQIILPLNRLTGRSIKSFDEVSEAMDWLAAEGKRP